MRDVGLEAEINETGGAALFVRLDVTSESDWRQAISATVARFGKLDILVNNAGVVAWGTLEDTTDQDWNLVMDVNVKGVFLGTKTAIPEMRKAGGGSIVNISSVSGNIGQESIQPVYNASKGGGANIYKVGRHSVRKGRHQGELGPSWFCEDADDRVAIGRSRAL